MARVLTLDVLEAQVLIDFFDDEDGLLWHHRLLLLPTPTAGVWIGATPDLGVQRIDLNDHRVKALQRNAEFPRDVYAESYIFDPITVEELATLKAEARSLAEVLGV